MKWTRVAAVADVPEDGTLFVRVDGTPICLYNVEGEICATHDTCTHGQASLAEGFIVDGKHIECPLHQGLFDIRTGRAVSAPCVVDVAVYRVKVEGDDVLVETAE
jgi:nitrite reductase/ring-hydroxylating ferredoxin subunit